MTLDFFRVKITDTIAAAGRLLRFSGSGRAGETITARDAVQQAGFASRPRDGAEGCVIRVGNTLILIASDDRANRPTLGKGDAAMYAGVTRYVKIAANGAVTIETDATVTIIADDIRLGGSTGLQKLLTEAAIGAYNAHTHAGTGSPPAPLMNALAHATAKVQGK